MRLGLIAAILFIGLSIANGVVYQRETTANPYATPGTVTGAILGAAAAEDAVRSARDRAVLREVGVVAVVGLLWGAIVLLGRRGPGR